MMTGCYPSRIDFTNFRGDGAGVLFPGGNEGLHPDEETIANVLKNRATLRDGRKMALR